MKFYISGSEEKYTLLEDMLISEDFSHSDTLSGEGEPVYVRGEDYVYMRRSFVCLETSSEERGYLPPSDCVWLLDENTPSFLLIKRMAEILAPCKFIPPTDTVRVEVPESLKEYEVSAEP